MNWNFEIDKAPRGRHINKPVKTKNGETVREVFEKEVIITASKCGKVTTSYWIPDEERWCMYTKDVPPIAWQPWPSHPKAA